MEQINRINKLREFIDNDKQAVLLTDDVNVYYFTDFYKSEGAFLLIQDEAYLLVDFRYSEAAAKSAKGCKVVQFRILTDTIKELLKKHNIDSMFIESEKITLSTYTRYVMAFNEVGVSLVSDGKLDNCIRNMRMIKSESEINFISYAQKITEKAYNEVLNYVVPGATERSIALELEYLLKKQGAQDVSFDLITITGKKTSLPHGVPAQDRVEAGDFFTMDIGALYNGYHSDMTRTVAVKSASEEMKKIYDIVLNAQVTALNSVKAGIKASEVDNIARKIISDSGYGECFGHSTGHGVGLDIHEFPNVSPKSETLLEDGMVITVEPGIYIENKFGVRIEDMILVKNNGFENFASITKQLIVI